ncbi:MAG: ActS/PrrB/RegB family redox-sensitive histidine kinase, partial [Pseudomonadota bacterium]
SVYKVGVWAALTFSVVFIAAYAHRIAAEAAQVRSALAATQLILSREERLAALGGLAAAAAHELGTPLATIQVTAKEMARDLDAGPLREDADLLVSQAERCRDILGRLSQRGEEGDAMHDRLTIDALLREAAEPFFEQVVGPTVMYEFLPQPGAEEPLTLRRQPEILYGLRNFIENAAEFAAAKVLLTAEWSAETLTIAIHDDGPGFSQEALARLGEPYLGGRAAARSTPRKKSGLGLGFFISKTLLERTGAQIRFDNQAWRDHADISGAWVAAEWPVSVLTSASAPLQQDVADDT